MDFVNSIDSTTTDEEVGKLFLKMRYSFIISVFTDLLTTTITDLITKINNINLGKKSIAKTLETFRDSMGWLFIFFNDPNTFRMFVYNGSRDAGFTPGDQIINKTYTSEILVKDEPVNWKILMNLSNNVVSTTLSPVLNAQRIYNNVITKYNKFAVSHLSNKSIDILPIIAAENKGNKTPKYPNSKNPYSNEITMDALLNYVKQFSNYCIFQDISCLTAMNAGGVEITTSKTLQDLNTTYKHVFSQYQVFNPDVVTGVVTAVAATATVATEAGATEAGATEAAVRSLLTILDSSIIQPDILNNIEPRVKARYDLLMTKVKTAIENESLNPFMGGSNSHSKSKKIQRMSKRRNNRRTYKKKARKTKRSKK
jgi:hypothetical protein